MFRRTGVLMLVGAAAASFAVTGAPAASGQNIQATVLRYDDSQAAEFKDAVARGVQVWNENVRNVRIEKVAAGQRAEIRVIATNGWPQANLGPVRPGGSVNVWMGREAVNQGYNTIRIAAHELGHSLGLPDRKPGPCSSLMSGSTGGVSCTNPLPNATEKAAVERNYGGFTARKPVDGRVLVDAA
ncbi:snapalysin family zinc-dependent metalloprotease [Spirillospora sp. CA-294931]|uniref:snapalysin family zinc-dependent metalloprotease n=1 Tax=Spirillospora sp. CA-294931 TaxID=3240042 RepID=UPI003D92CE0E